MALFLIAFTEKQLNEPWNIHSMGYRAIMLKRIKWLYINQPWKNLQDVMLSEEKVSEQDLKYIMHVLNKLYNSMCV